MSSMCPYCQAPAATCGAVALMKEPANWRGLRNGPAGGVAFRVNSSWNWSSLAAKDGWDARNLIYYNFRTYDPREINWYLYHFVGCRHSDDGRNLTFRNACPGIVYTRRQIIAGGSSANMPGNAHSLNFTKINLDW
jgi:hypothetical protein